MIRVRLSPRHAEPVFVELRPGPPFTRLFADFKLRSFVRVPVRVNEAPRKETRHTEEPKASDPTGGVAPSELTLKGSENLPVQHLICTKAIWSTANHAHTTHSILKSFETGCRFTRKAK